VVGFSSEGCISNSVETSSIIVHPNPVISVNSGSICAGDSFTINATGAVTYTYGGSTNNVVTPSVTTNFDVVGTNSFGCVSTTSAISTVSVRPGPAITVNSSNICAGESFTIIPNGAFSYTYSSGSPVSTPAANVSYTVTGADIAGCTSSAICNVTVNPIPNVSASTGANTVCAGSSATINASGATTYTWSTGASSSALVVTAPSSNRTYTVTGETNGCKNTATVTLNVAACVGIESVLKNASAVKVYPNPTNGVLTVDLANGLNKTIEVTDISGRIVSKIISAEDSLEFNLSNLAEGVYYLKVSSNYVNEIIKVVKH
jgi:hypothetical protein